VCRATSRLSCFLVVILGLGGLAACGGGEDAVIRVGHTPITRATVGHWMEVLAAGDYRSELAKPPPAGLVSDPANYSRCVRAVRRQSAKAESKAEADKKANLCRQLYAAVKLQAVNFLTNAAWYAEDAKEHGEKVTDKEIERKYLLTKRREYPAPGQLEHFLAELHRTRADEYYLLKRNILAIKLLERLQRQHVDLHSRNVATKLAEEWQAKWTARTSCGPGYVASQCKQYKGPETVPAPDTILQQLAA